MFLENSNISSKIKRSKVTDYAALIFFLRLEKSAKDKVRFPNWLYLLSKLFMGHRYRPLKTIIITPVVVVCYIFFIEPPFK